VAPPLAVLPVSVFPLAAADAPTPVGAVRDAPPEPRPTARRSCVPTPLAAADNQSAFRQCGRRAVVAVVGRGGDNRTARVVADGIAPNTPVATLPPLPPTLPPATVPQPPTLGPSTRWPSAPRAPSSPPAPPPRLLPITVAVLAAAPPSIADTYKCNKKGSISTLRLWAACSFLRDNKQRF